MDFESANFEESLNEIQQIIQILKDLCDKLIQSEYTNLKVDEITILIENLKKKMEIIKKGWSKARYLLDNVHNNNKFVIYFTT